MLDDRDVSRILVITAHPDDSDFGAAGTIAGWTDRGIEVSYCVVTDGDSGGRDMDIAPADLAVIRRAEQVEAAKIVGVSDVRYLGYHDGSVEPSLALRKDLTRVIRQVRPDRLVCQSPERNYARVGASHPDHRAVGAAAIDAVYPDARNPFAFRELLIDEGLAAWTVPEVWVMASPQASHFVDVTANFDRKIAALRAHESQTGHMENLAEFIRGWLSRAAEQAGWPQGRLAEVFQVVQTA